jgi:hypothetical protein
MPEKIMPGREICQRKELKAIHHFKFVKTTVRGALPVAAD